MEERVTERERERERERELCADGMTCADIADSRKGQGTSDVRSTSHKRLTYLRSGCSTSLSPAELCCLFSTCHNLVFCVVVTANLCPACNSKLRDHTRYGIRIYSLLWALA